jgi:hypothetical protein
MSTTTTHNTTTTNNAGFPPAPGETHQETNCKGDTREVVLNNTRITMLHDGKQWWNVKVTAA